LKEQCQQIIDLNAQIKTAQGENKVGNAAVQKRECVQKHARFHEEEAEYDSKVGTRIGEQSSQPPS
jgi:hypothetical protein